MSGMTPFFREVGSGPGVVCLHANASTSGQWRSLLDALSPKFHVLAADSYGSGKSPPWPTDREAWLRDEVALLEPVFAQRRLHCANVKRHDFQYRSFVTGTTVGMSRAS